MENRIAAVQDTAAPQEERVPVPRKRGGGSLTVSSSGAIRRSVGAWRSRRP